ncbi:carbon-nitrogen hydrolase family protein [Maribellus comscasis]|uniref:Carbon-nitrogen hydrolase family protein n=1 Tax=Maribellus comscasis TaxID=2681766 RepID=A0A6I6JVZ0_9BACT|nr:carbon-nitrogen hydrolase family protein [Maribellus comscasis]QGY44312.1 carbon-nitrogen hydrolase family protein [Maribellus comscasis]
MKRSVFILILLGCCFDFAVNGQNNTDGQSGKLVVAACQFPVSADIAENYDWIKKQMIEARLKKADIVQFPECALSGYPEVDLKTLDGFDWDLLVEKTDSILSLTKQLKIWVLLGSIHRLSDGVKPHNSLYVINDEGKIVDRYDKRFCTGGDLKHFSPGDHFVNFDLNGVNCGLLICYDIRFPELYREYRKRNTDLIFQSFYNARQKKGSIHPVIMPITSQARAATNYFYISLTNSSATESWPCHFITPDGLIQNKLTTNVPGILISNVDISENYYDASKAFRENAINGILNSGETVKDPRSENRSEIIEQ